MERELIFSILAFCIAFWSNILYWKGIIRSEIIPHPFTFFLWIIIMSIAAIELVLAREVLGSIPIILVVVSTI